MWEWRGKGYSNYKFFFLVNMLIGDTSVENVLRMQYNLTKHVNISIDNSECMSYLDFTIYHDILLNDSKEQNK